MIDGDTLREILAFGILIEAVAAYDPNETNFRKFSDTVRENSISNASSWSCGVYSATT